MKLWKLAKYFPNSSGKNETKDQQRQCFAWRIKMKFYFQFQTYKALIWKNILLENLQMDQLNRKKHSEQTNTTESFEWKKSSQK